MRVIIAGSRSITELKHVQDAIREANMTITEVVSGGARGVDLLGEVWARMNGKPIKQFLPKFNAEKDPWNRIAPLVRNKEMADYADCLIAIRRDAHKSKGTSHMIKLAMARGMPICCMDITKNETTGVEEQKVWKVNCPES